MLASFSQMLDRAGFVLEHIYPTSTEFSILEACKNKECTYSAFYDELMLQEDQQTFFPAIEFFKCVHRLFQYSQLLANDYFCSTFSGVNISDMIY